jgi:FkbM family methyltransferase
MHYDFIEIGTSDFKTLLEESTDSTIGISIEPILLYLDNLPNLPGVKKLNLAVSDRDSIINVYWIHPADIEKYNLPYWIRGCNSINSPHPTASSKLSELNVSHAYQVSKCRCVSWNTLLIENQISSIDLLKIDTEGHDSIILKQVASSNLTVYPKKIIFEHNELSEPTSMLSAITMLESLGYVRTSDLSAIDQVLELSTYLNSK